MKHSATEYTWIHDVPAEWGISPTPSATTNRIFTYKGKTYAYTTEELTGLGTVTGNVTLTIKGTTEVEGSVFGGGAQSAVSGNTVVDLQDDAQVGGNVFGGGDQGKVDGSTKVNVMYTEP